MGSYVRGTLMKDEYVLYEAKISLWSQLPLILLGAFALLWTTVTMAADTAMGGNRVEVLFFILGMLPWVIVFFRYKTTELVITNKRVIAKFGLISRHSIEMKLAKVESVQVNQGILGRIFNYGSLIVSGAGNPMAPVPSISNPLEFRRIAMEAQDQTGPTMESRPNQGIGIARLFGFFFLFLMVVAIAVVLNHKSHTSTQAAFSGESSPSTQIKEFPTDVQNRASAQKPPTASNGLEAFDSGLGGQELRTYTNERFGFSIDYPQSFVAKEPPENGDGITLESTDGNAILVVSGSNNSGIEMPTYYDAAVQSVKGELGYHTASKNWFVITWKEGERLTYQKTFVGDGSENSFTFSFPDGQKSEYDDVVTKIEKSFHHGDLGHAW